MKSDSVGLARMVIRLFDHWGITADEQCAALGLWAMDSSTLERYREGVPTTMDRDQSDRIGHLLWIHSMLRMLFPHDRKLAYAWMTARNNAFNNLAPIQVLCENGFAGLLMIRTYLSHWISR